MRLIDADELISDMYEDSFLQKSNVFEWRNGNVWIKYGLLKEYIEKQEEKEIVCCKNCVHSEETKGVAENVLNCKRLKMVVTPEWFCAEGRKNEID